MEGDYIGSKDLQLHQGPDSAEWLIENLQEEGARLMEILLDDQRLHEPTFEQANLFLNADKCYICKNPFGPKNGEGKVLDHDIVTGEYRGPAHSR